VFRLSVRSPLLPSSKNAIRLLQRVAEDFRANHTLARQRNQGKQFEKYREDASRVIPIAHADAAARGSLLYREAQPVRAYESRIPLADYADVVGGIIGGDVPFGAPLGFKQESFENHHVRGPSLAPASLDVGPRYALAHPSADAVAPTLLAATRGYAAAAAGEAAQVPQALEPKSVAFASTLRAVRLAAGERAPAPESPQVPRLTSSGLVFPNGSVALAGAAGIHTLAVSHAPSMRALQGNDVESRWDLSRTVAEQWSGATGDTGHDVVHLGRAAALGVPRDGARGASRISGAPHSGSGSADFHPTTVDGGGVGAAGAPLPDIRCVVHPLDAFPGPRRAANEAAVAAQNAERFRRTVAGAQRRRDYITLARHPHGILGVDGPDNLASAVYGDVAARAADAQERVWEREAKREANLLKAHSSVARRGYDLLSNDSDNGLNASLRVSKPLIELADLTRAQKDGGSSFLVRKAPATVPIARLDTRRTLGLVDEPSPAVGRGRRSRVEAIIGGETQGRKTDVITGLPLPQNRAPLHMEERIPSARSQHPALVESHNPIGR
jgi:hypothetical protein